MKLWIDSYEDRVLTESEVFDRYINHLKDAFQFTGIDDTLLSESLGEFLDDNDDRYTQVTKEMIDE